MVTLQKRRRYQPSKRHKLNGEKRYKADNEKQENSNERGAAVFLLVWWCKLSVHLHFPTHLPFWFFFVLQEPRTQNQLSIQFKSNQNKTESPQGCACVALPKDNRWGFWKKKLNFITYFSLSFSSESRFSSTTVGHFADFFSRDGTFKH